MYSIPENDKGKGENKAGKGDTQHLGRALIITTWVRKASRTVRKHPRSLDPNICRAKQQRKTKQQPGRAMWLQQSDQEVRRGE